MPAPAPPEVVDAALMAIADGASQSEAAALVGASQSSLSRWLARKWERAQRLSAALHGRWLKRTFRGMDRMHVSLMRVVEDERLDDKGRPITRGSDKAQAANVILSHAMPSGPEQLTINGDVNTQVNVAIDARRLAVIRSGTKEEREARSLELREKLGF